MPDWMTDKPDAPQSLLGRGTAVSDGMQTAIRKAKTQARGDIASTVEVRFQSLTKDFQEEVSGEYLQQFTQAQKEVTSQFLVGTTARKRSIVEENGRYRAYVLMEMPIGQASEELLSKLRASEELYERFRASEAFEELKREASRYEEAQPGAGPDSSQGPDRR
ncbi:LPP20 family lipoprotein [Salinibacter ruber]|uniref:LPP20 family lipoprotein n=1 Tax=Salinibacter ruber TaxID=146919 RepID=UPI00216A2472|nr:LPP20 family lipoprotein [Salinibacter ruber]